MPEPLSKLSDYARARVRTVLTDASAKAAQESIARSGSTSRRRTQARSVKVQSKSLRASAKRAKKDDESSGGGGVNGAGLLLRGLKQIDIPGSLVRASINDVVTGFEEDGPLGGLSAALSAMNPTTQVIRGASREGVLPVGVAATTYSGTTKQRNKKAEQQKEQVGSGTYLDQGLRRHDIKLPWALRTGIGFGVDVGTDPLSYLGGAGVLEKGAAGVAREVLEKGAATAAKKVAANVAKKGLRGAARSADNAVEREIAQNARAAFLQAKRDVAQAGIKLGKDQGSRLGREGVEKASIKEAIETAAKQKGDELATKIADKGTAAASSDELKLFVPKSQGGGLFVNVPGTGRVARGVGRTLRITKAKTPIQVKVLPKGAVQGLPRTVNKVTRGALRNAKYADSLGRLFGGDEINRDLKLAARSGAVDRAVPAIKAIAAKSRTQAAARVVGAGLKDEYAKISKNYKKHLPDVVASLEGDAEAAARLAQQGVDPSDMKVFIHKLYKTAQDSGIDINELDDYFPRQITQEAREAMGLKRGPNTTGKAGFERGRKVGEGTVLPGGKKLEGQTNARIRDEVNRYAQEELGFKGDFYEQNPNRVMPAYIESLSRRIGRKSLEKALVDEGILSKVDLNLLKPVSKKKLEKLATKLDKLVSKVANSNERLADARRGRQEASATQLGALDLFGEAEASVAAARAAQEEADAAPEIAETLAEMQRTIDEELNPQPFLDEGVTREEQLGADQLAVGGAQRDLTKAQTKAQAGEARVEAVVTELQKSQDEWRDRWNALTPAERGERGNLTPTGGAVIKAGNLDFEQAGSAVQAASNVAEEATRASEQAATTVHSLARAGWKLRKDGTMRLEMVGNLGGSIGADIVKNSEEAIGAAENVVQALKGMGYDSKIKAHGDFFELDVNPLRDRATQLGDAAKAAETQAKEARKALPEQRLEDILTPEGAAVRGEFYHGGGQKLDEFETGGGDASQLMTPGLYTTNNGDEVAFSYMGNHMSRVGAWDRLEEGADPNLYTLAWAHPEREPVLLDFDVPLMDQQLDEMARVLGQDDPMYLDALERSQRMDAARNAWGDWLEDIEDHATNLGVEPARVLAANADFMRGTDPLSTEDVIRRLHSGDLSAEQSLTETKRIIEQYARGQAADEFGLEPAQLIPQSGYLDPEARDALLRAREIEANLLRSHGDALHGGGSIADGITHTGGIHADNDGPIHRVSIFFDPTNDTKIVGRVSYRGKGIQDRLDSTQRAIQQNREWAAGEQAMVDQEVTLASNALDANRMDLVRSEAQVDHHIFMAEAEREVLRGRLMDETLVPSAREQAERADSLWTQHQVLLAKAVETQHEGVRLHHIYDAQAKKAEAQLEQLGPDLQAGGRQLHTMRTQQVETIASEIQKGLKAQLQSDPTLYGAPEMIDILNRTVQMTDPENVRQFLKYYDKGLNYLKAWQIATPGFHLRNLMGGMFNNYLAGVEVGAYRRFARQVRRYNKGELDDDSAIGQVLAHIGDGQYSAAEIQSGQHAAVPAHARINPLDSRNAWLALNTGLGGKVEHLLRGALALDVLEKGGTIDDAIEAVAKYHFDYEDLSRFEKGVVKRVIPFYTWTRKNLPLQVEMVVRKPGAYSKYWQAKTEIENANPEGEIVPPWISNHGLGIQLPFERGGGHLSLNPDLPFTNTIAEAPVTPKGLLGMTTPIIKAPLEATFDQQVFKDIPLHGPTNGPAWANIPGLSQILKTSGLADDKGVVGYKTAYLMEQLGPLLGRLRRTVPTEKRYQKRHLTSLLSVLGIPVKTNTTIEQQDELLRRKFDGGRTITLPRRK